MAILNAYLQMSVLPIKMYNSVYRHPILSMLLTYKRELISVTVIISHNECNIYDLMIYNL